jgi:hypothetical protein
VTITDQRCIWQVLGSNLNSNSFLEWLKFFLVFLSPLNTMPGYYSDHVTRASFRVTSASSFSDHAAIRWYRLCHYKKHRRAKLRHYVLLFCPSFEGFVSQRSIISALRLKQKYHLNSRVPRRRLGICQHNRLKMKVPRLFRNVVSNRTVIKFCLIHVLDRRYSSLLNGQDAVRRSRQSSRMLQGTYLW